MESRSFTSAGTLLLTIAVIGLVTPSWSSNYEVLHSFSAFPDAQSPEAGLVFDSAGNLYGTTFNGGTHDVGAVYELSPVQGGGWKEQVIYSFTGGADGARPVSTLAVDRNGKLYGTASMGGSGGGVVFELSPSGGSWAQTVIHTFVGGTDGLFPLGGVILDGFGNLIGTASNGGTTNNGIVFQLSAPPPGSSSWSESLIHTFQGGNDDSIPAGKLTMDRIGRIYGATRGVGSVYRLNRSNRKWVYHSLWCFCNGGGGETLYGGVAVDGNFHIYGTTYGSVNGNGEVFELTVGRPSVVIPLYQFTGKADGANPQGGVVLDALSRLWGTTAFGGNNGVGVLFSLALIDGKWVETPSHSFSGIPNSDGANPITDLILDANGNLFGTTYNGGSVNGGVVFKFTP